VVTEKGGAKAISPASRVAREASDNVKFVMGTAFLVVLSFLERWAQKSLAELPSAGQRSRCNIGTGGPGKLPNFGCIHWDAGQAATVQVTVDFLWEVFCFPVFELYRTP
jgi:hypothetical protein